jgi:hypothetical protein
LRLTYREAWERHIKTAIEDSKRFRKDMGGGKFDSPDDDEPRPTGRRVTGGFDIENATEAEANAFFDTICGKRKHTGGRFWVPGEVEGVVEYNGPEKAK